MKRIKTDIAVVYTLCKMTFKQKYTWYHKGIKTHYPWNLASERELLSLDTITCRIEEDNKRIQPKLKNILYKSSKS